MVLSALNINHIYIQFIFIISLIQKAEVFRLALRSDDELFHVSLYDWLFSMNMTEKLLEVSYNA